MSAGNRSGHPHPEVWVNCAVSLDGRLAFAGGRRAYLSGPEDLERVQRLRAKSDGILVGVGTVIADNPSLRVHWEFLSEPPDRTPTRIVLDRSGRTPPRAKVLDGSIPTLIVTTQSAKRAYPLTVEVLRVPQSTSELGNVLALLADRGFHRLLVEGGASVLASFLRQQLFDRLTVFVAPIVIGGATAPPMVAGPDLPPPSEGTKLRLVSSERLGEGVLLTWVPTTAHSSGEE